MFQGPGVSLCLPGPLNVVPFLSCLSFLFWDPNHKIGHPIQGATFKGVGSLQFLARLQFTLSWLCVGFVVSACAVALVSPSCSSMVHRREGSRRLGRCFDPEAAYASYVFFCTYTYIVAFCRRPCFLQVLTKHLHEMTLSSPIHLNAVALEHPEPKKAGKP